MKRFLFAALLLLCTTLVHAQLATYQVVNPVVTTSGSFTGLLSSAGTYTSPYSSTSRTVSNTVTADTMSQRIYGPQHSVTAQFTYTKASGSPSGVVTTEVSCDTGTAVNYTILYTDSCKNQSGGQTYSHVITGWPYSTIRLRYSGTSAPNSGSWKGLLIIRYKREEDWESYQPNISINQF